MAAPAYKKTFSGKLFSKVDHIVSKDEKYLFCKYWKPEREPRYLVFMAHGFGGHCARFEELAVHLNLSGGYVFAHDHVGHGESEGPRTTVGNYEIYIEDILDHIEKVRSEYPTLPLFLLGQSMGGALAVLTAHQNPEIFNGVIILSGMLLVDPQMSSSVKKFFINILAAVLPEMQLSTLDESQSSRDTDEVEIIENDPLKSSVVKSEMALQLMRIPKAIGEIMKDFSVPFLALHGEADKTCDPEGSRLLHDRSKSADKTLKIYPECYHDLTHELPDDRKQCIDDISEWINARVPPETEEQGTGS